jgi:hypothetical protein
VIGYRRFRRPAADISSSSTAEAAVEAMPRFASRKSGSKTPSDIILKMKRLLAAAVTRHAKLQHESQQLHQEHELLQAVCGAFGVYI